MSKIVTHRNRFHISVHKNKNTFEEWFFAVLPFFEIGKYEDGFSITFGWLIWEYQIDYWKNGTDN